ncbi:ATPase [Nocardiopsis alba]|uniref:RapZ C-terminal domain-containing protein n=1 Tax=Nocardiopsis alba TaxID=53437 RepID=UPI0036711170
MSHATTDVPQVQVISFGYGHAEPPAAHITLDLRVHFRDPHVSPEMRYMTANDAQVREHVLATSGVRAAITGVATSAVALVSGPSGDTPVTIATGCAGGRHRAPTAAMAIAGILTTLGITVDLVHRDLEREVISR